MQAVKQEKSIAEVTSKSFAFLLAALGVPMLMFGVFAAAEAVTPQKTESLYVGFYQEDPIDNPEDPTMGALYLKLPVGGGDFSGNMFFTYVGCQTSNVGTITGMKLAEQLRGTWTGTTDGTAQHGDFAGTRVTAKDAYAGTYSVAGGKQHIAIPDCIQYYIASKGTFELFVAGASEPATFSISVHDKLVSWTSQTGAFMTMVSVMDPELARAGGNATLWQTLVIDGRNSANLNGVKLLKGHSYLATVGAVDQSFKRISFGSIGFVAP